MRKWLWFMGLGAAGVAACDDAGPSTMQVQADAQVDATAPADTGTLDAAVVDAGADAAVDMAEGDAYVPLMPDEQPTAGDANLPGPADLTAAVPAGQARAGLVDDQAEALTGPDAQCRPGCFRLDNAVISVCIQGESTFSQLTFAGGNIIDAYPVGHGRDRLREITFGPSLGEVSVEQIGIVRDGSDGGPAIVRTTGRAGGGRTVQAYLSNANLPGELVVTTEYRLAPDSNRVDVLSWYQAESAQSIQVTDLIFFGDRSRTFSPGSMIGAAPSGQIDFIAAQDHDVAYAWRVPDEPISVLNIPIDAFPLRPVILERTTFRPGDVKLYRRQLRVGHDIEAVRDAAPGAVPVPIVGPPGATVDIDDGEVQVTRLHLGEDGMRTAMLVPGAYQARYLDWPGGDPEPQWIGAVADEVVMLEPPPAPATVNLTVTDQNAVGIGVKVVLTGGGEERIEHVLDSGAIALPPGEWTITITRGWHYSVHREALTLMPGESRNLVVQLTEEIPFDGWSAGEFHQHATLSLDSEVPLRGRVLGNIGEGVGFMVPSEHDVLYDYHALATRMGVLDRIAVPLSGVEISPLVGHMGAYGMPYDWSLAAGGAPALVEPNGDFWRVRTMPDLVALAREKGAQVLQINHPRDSTGYFDSVGLNVAEPIDAIESDQWTTDFDTVEVYNGQGDFCPVLADWMGLLNQGMRLTAVGNSDTHGEGKAPGYPRNYLRTAAPRASGVSGEEVATALREGRSVIGGGAVLDFVEGPEPGDRVEAQGTLRLHPRLRTPGYLHINRLLAFHNGRMVFDQAIESAPEQIVDFAAPIDVPVDGDGPVVLLALGDERLGVIAGGPVFALANPIWVDADGDGTITPAGPGAIDLPEMSICQ